MKHGQSSSLIWNSKVPTLSHCTLRYLHQTEHRITNNTLIPCNWRARPQTVWHRAASSQRPIKRFTLHSFAEGIDYSLTGLIGSLFFLLGDEIRKPARNYPLCQVMNFKWDYRGKWEYGGKLGLSSIFNQTSFWRGAPSEFIMERAQSCRNLIFCWAAH